MQNQKLMLKLKQIPSVSGTTGTDKLMSFVLTEVKNVPIYSTNIFTFAFTKTSTDHLIFTLAI